MKKFLALCLAMTMSLSLLVGCGGEKPTTEPAAEPAAAPAVEDFVPTPVRVMALKGPTAMGMVKLMAESDANETSTNVYDFTLAGAIDEVTPKLVQGDVDIAAVPANLASVLYNKTDGAVQVLAINTLGVIYIVESGDTIQSVADLKGKTIYASGKGASPEYALNHILTGNGLDPATDVTIEWKNEHAECAAALASQDDAIAMLPQPFVTIAQSKNEKIRMALDLTTEWDAFQKDSDEPSAMITGVVVARKAFIDEHPDAINLFLDQYAASTKFVNENTDAAAALIGGYDIIPEPIAKKALPHCSITFIDGDEMASKLSGYLNVLFTANPQAVGGALPDENFYYSR